MATRFVTITGFLSHDPRDVGARPDNDLPVGWPDRPDQGLPGHGHPDHGLPGHGHPDHGLPGQGGRPDNTLPGGPPPVIWPPLPGGPPITWPPPAPGGPPAPPVGTWPPRPGRPPVIWPVPPDVPIVWPPLPPPDPARPDNTLPPVPPDGSVGVWPDLPYHTKPIYVPASTKGYIVYWLQGAGFVVRPVGTPATPGNELPGASGGAQPKR